MQGSSTSHQGFLALQTRYFVGTAVALASQVQGADAEARAQAWITSQKPNGIAIEFRKSYFVEEGGNFPGEVVGLVVEFYPNDGEQPGLPVDSQ